MPIEVTQIGFRHVFRWVHFLKQFHLSDISNGKKCVYIVSGIKVYEKKPQPQTDKMNRNFSFPMELVI